MSRDLILHHGTVLTHDPVQPVVDALAIRGARVWAIGTRAQVRAAAASDALEVDLGGRGVVPGLIDAHLHFELTAFAWQQVDAEAPTLAALQARVAARAAATPPGQWILGWGWDHNRWGGVLPDHRALDAAAPHHPVYLSAKSGHAGWANSAAMAAAGLQRAPAAVAGGEVCCQPDGRPTGVLLEAAMDLVTRVIPQPSLDDSVQAMDAAQDRALAAGLTGVHDLDGTRALAAWQVLRRQGRQRLRVCKSIPSHRLDEALALGLRTGLGDEWIRIGGVKFFADGALGPRTAWLLNPYEGESTYHGMPLWEPRELAAAVARADQGGLAVWVHAIGDRAGRETLDALAATRGAGVGGSCRRLRHRLEHAQLLHPDDQARLAPLGVVASVQPIHATSDMHIADQHWGQRAADAYAFAALLARGAVLAFGSDSPVETLSPLAGLHAAVTRRRADGSPGPDGWYPAQRLSIDAALRAYTIGPAYAAEEEQDKGTLAPGYLADLVVLDRPLAAVQAMELADLQVLGTMVGGAWRWRSHDFQVGDGHAC